MDAAKRLVGGADKMVGEGMGSKSRLHRTIMLEKTTEAGPALTEGRLAEVEGRLGVRLPDSYREFLLAYNGGRPAPSHFLAYENNKPGWMRVHFFFGIDDPVRSCDILWNSAMFAGRIPDRVIPIACDEGGNRFCLDLRQAVDGPILFWDHVLEGRGPDIALYLRIAGTFSEWIASLSARA
jgi:cell wall assembly regulator SMI1